MKFKYPNYLIFFFIFVTLIFQSSLWAETLNKLDDFLKEGEISTKIMSKSSDEIKSVKPSKPASKIIKSNLPSAKSNKNLLTLPNASSNEQQIQINVNGKERIITIPYINPKPVKKQAHRISESQAPVRISAEKSEFYYEIPAPYENFGFPINPEDKIRCEGENKIKDIYELVVSINSENYVEIVNKAHKIGYETIEKYSNYPDICAIIQLYLNDSFIKMYKIAGSFDKNFSTSREFFKCSQLSSQYSHLKDTSQAMTTFFKILENRQSEIKANEKSLVDSNSWYYQNIENNYNKLNGYKENTYFGIPNEETKKNHAYYIALTYSEICFDYAKIYENYMKMNNKTEADKIFKIEKNGNEYILSGKLYEAYKSTPYEQAYKYKYFETTPDNQSVVITSEVKVKMFRDSEKFLNLIENMKYLQPMDKIDSITNGQSRNEKRTLDMCNYINDFQPSAGSESEGAEEKISSEKLARFKKYAYAQSGMDEMIDYYKRKPLIKELYFARTDDTKLTDSDIVLPNEYLNLCVKADLSSYFKLAAPDYAFLCRVYTVKQPLQSEDKVVSSPDVPSQSASTTKNKVEHEVDKQKFVVLIPDVLNGGYYAKFQINESDSSFPPVPEPPDNPPTIPIVALSKTKSNLKTTKTLANEVIYKQLVQAGKDAEKESISVLSGFKGYEDGLPLYENQKFFNKQLVRSSWKGLNVDKNVINNSKSFCISGGQEITYASEIDKKNQNFVLVQNQADWFIIEAHGEGADGHIEFQDDKDVTITVFPNELEGKYNEDIDVLILDACWCLEYFKRQLVKKWQKVLPEGLILGFCDEVDPDYTPTVIQKFSSALQKQMTPKAIGDLYLDVCRIHLNTDDSWFPLGTNTFENVAYLLNGTYGYLKKVSFRTKYGITVEGYIKKYKNI